MKYVVDIDAMKGCMEHIHGIQKTGLGDDIFKFIDKFPKQKFTDGEDKEMSYWLPFTAEDGTKYKTCGKCNHDILDGEVDYYCPKCGCEMDPRTTLGN